jgi:hypothetical protein
MRSLLCVIASRICEDYAYEQIEINKTVITC